MYGKIFPAMWTGSLMGKGSVTQNLMSYAVSNCDADGCVELNATLLSCLFGDPKDKVEEAITHLCSPDPESRTPDEDGRRLTREGQFLYHIVNYCKYRDLRDLDKRREQTKEAMRRYRTRQKEAQNNVSNSEQRDPDVSECNQCEPKQKQKQKQKQEEEKEGAAAPLPAPPSEPPAKRKRFQIPSPDQVEEYAESLGYRLDARAFCDFYATKGWVVGKSPMKDWRAAVRTWKARDGNGSGSVSGVGDHVCRRCGGPADFMKADGAGQPCYWCRTCQPGLYKRVTGRPA